MSLFETATATAAYRECNQDRIAVFDSDERTILVVADGAGGIGGGEIAASYVVEQVRLRSRENHLADWCALLSQIDHSMPAGEATGVIIEVTASGIRGASVGDSQAWIVRDGEIQNLTQQQRRKPLLGSGEAVPVAFEHAALDGLLIAATDGFCNYVDRRKLGPTIAQAWFPTLAAELLKLVRLPSGDLWDDVGIIVCRRRPMQRPRVKHYEI
jgi:serine/threonine protein phosphatase PrpC